MSLCNANIYAFPSKREGLRLATIERLSSGLPLLLSNVWRNNDYSVSSKIVFSMFQWNMKGLQKEFNIFMKIKMKQRKLVNLI